MRSPPVLSKFHLHRIQRCFPPVWRNAPRTNPPQEPTPLPPSGHGGLAGAFAAYSLLRRRAPRPPTPSHLLLVKHLSPLLRCCAAQRARHPGAQLHAHAVSLGLHDHPSLLPGLAAFYISLGVLSDARAAVEQARTKARAFPWNLLIWASAGKGLWKDAILAYDKMVELGVEADRFTYPSVLRACGELRELELGREIGRRIGNSGSGWDLYAWNALVGMYVKCGELEDARKVFDGMVMRDVVSWNSMVSGYVSRGMWEEAFELLRQVPEASGVNTVTWNTVAAGNLKMGNYAEVIRLVSQMRNGGPGVDFVTVVIGLKACARFENVKVGKEMHGLAVRLCYDGMENVVNSLITMYSRCKMTSSAYVLFRTGSVRSLVTWNAMLAGFACMEQAEEASLLFREMVGSGVCPNDVTVLTMLSLGARLGHLHHGRDLHCYILKHGLDGCKLLQNSLVDMYSKSGKMSTAQRVFAVMQCQDRLAYTSLILGYGMQREGTISLRLFDEMIASGVEPDHITMVAVLSACSHSGLVTKGQLLFAKMVSVFGIAPRVEHFSCMVDLYCREGLVKMAEEVIHKMPLQPTAAMLATLVEACRVHGNIEIGDRAAKKLMAMRTNNPGHYKLIANMYASAKCWQELAKVRSLMSEMDLRMIPSHSLLELGYDIYSIEQDGCLNHDEHGGLSDHVRDADSSSSEEVKCDEAIGG